MKIDFEGVTRTLDLDHIKLKHAAVVQDFTGLPVLDWVQGLFSRDMEPGGAELTPAQAKAKMTAFTDPKWIFNMAAAHWLMRAQNGDVPPLDDDYDCEVLDFAVALYSAKVEDVKAKRVPDKPDPTVPRARRAPSSRPTAPRKPKTVKGEVVESAPLPRVTGS